MIYIRKTVDRETCLDCGIPLPVRPAGWRGDMVLRCDACRSHHRYKQQLKSTASYYRCACGRRKPWAASTCRACYLVAKRQDVRVCLWCGVTFWRRANAHDKRMFCSGSCRSLAQCYPALYAVGSVADRRQIAELRALCRAAIKRLTTGDPADPGEILG